MKDFFKKPSPLFRRRISLLLATSAFSVLSACGGGGGGTVDSLDSSNETPAASNNNNTSGSARPSSKLFVADSGSATIGSIINPDFSFRFSIVDRLINGPQTGLAIGNSVTGMAVDNLADRLFVVQATKISVFDKGGEAHGDIAPSRTLASSPTASFGAAFLDSGNDRLYVVDGQQLQILVFDNASTAVNATPARSISIATASGASPGSLKGLTLDLVRDILYAGLVDPQGCELVGIDTASKQDGAVTPNRVIDDECAENIAIDTTHDRLYTVNSGARVGIIDRASTLSGASAGDGFPVPMSQSLKNLAYDTTRDRLFVIEPAALYQINHVRMGFGNIPVQVVTIPVARALTAIALK
ncbi:MAG: hypothetical protein V4632_21820 [Pseudomonadota bacterium]